MAALGWLFTRDLFSKNTVWWPVGMFPVPESWSQQARKQGLPDKVSFLTLRKRHLQV